MDAYEALVAMLREWGLETLAPEVLRLLQEGHSQEQVSVLIQDTEPYRQRFVGNDARRKAGLRALSPGEYLATEASYRRIMESAGLPVGFYDQPSDFASWIGNDVSPNEIQSRVNYAVDAAQRLDAGTKAAFWEFYNVGETDLAAFFLDRERAMPYVQKVAKAARIGAEGHRQGIGITKQQAELYASGTLVEGEIEQTVAGAVDAGKRLNLIGALYGDRFEVTDAVEEAFLGSAPAREKRKKLSARETAEFSGSGGLSRTALGSDTGRY